MPKTKIRKQEDLRNLEAKIKEAKAVVFATYNGLGVKASEELRNQLRAEQGEMIVAKKTLLNLALKSTEIPEADTKGFDGQVAVLFSKNDEVLAAKLLKDFKKANADKVDFAGGILEGKFISKAGVVALADLPSKQELLAKLVGTINAPVSGFVNVLAGNLRGLVNVVNAIKDAKSA
jgi:large subunit ribosomal protein L10